jgi:peptide/nickel transport system ATP-binding protein
MTTRTATAAETLLEVHNVSRVYRRGRTSPFGPRQEVQALKDVDLRIPQGRRFGIVGESGSGKSTLVRLLAGLEHPTSGEIRFDGNQVSGLREKQLGFLRRELQVVFQDPMSSLDPRMRVRHIIAEPLLHRRQHDVGSRVSEVLDAVGLPESAADRYPHQFSGGQRQRISIARALAPHPSVLIADEAVSALDVSVRAQILNLISSLVEDLDLTLVFVSHDLSVVRHLCDQVAVLHRGRLVETGPTEEVYTRPQDDYTRRLVASIPTIRGALEGVGARELAQAMPAHGGEESR